MNQRLLIAALAAIFFAFTACNFSNKSSHNKEEQVGEASTLSDSTINYKIVANYFINNTVIEIVPLKITNAKDFYKYFGAAATMGKEGVPTTIDFSKEYAIVVDLGIKQNKTEIKALGLTKKGNDLVLEYSITEGESQSFTTRPFLMLLVGNDNVGNIILSKR